MTDETTTGTSAGSSTARASRAQAGGAVVTATLPDAEATRAFGRALADVLRAGDLVVLTGALGAGKTTLTQGLGAGLHVRGQVASPTFIIAREHPPLPRDDGSRGPALVHVDAYRLGSLDEVDALDLDSSLDDSVTVVEWGEGWVEGLAADRLEVTIDRPRGGEAAAQDADAGERVVTVRAVGARWDGVELPAVGAPALAAQAPAAQALAADGSVRDGVAG